MNKIFRNRFNLFVSELQEDLGKWEVILRIDPKIEQIIFISGFIRNNNEYKLTRFPLEMHSYTNKLQPALIADARVELNKECELRVYFNETLNPYDTILIIRLTSRLRDFCSKDDITYYIHLEIPTKEIQDIFVLPGQLPSGELVIL